MANMITACKDCANCKHFEMLDKFYMMCHAREKKYMYGQSVPCNDKEKITKKKKEKDNAQV